ncbi:hypothetical protein CRUP_001372 [Coryphaenoides rupestris]|nr:hypothetical protein CRUP_001372 [Coryphaenoides rupestris]
MPRPVSVKLDFIKVLAHIDVDAAGRNSCLRSMGTTASAAPPAVSVAAPPECLHGNGMADSRHSLSGGSVHTINIHSGKAKSIITNKADVLNTTAGYGAPNFRRVKGPHPLYGMGQPSLNGFTREVIFFCVREEPVLFLHKGDNFLHDFSKLSESVFYVYNDIEFFKDEPQTMAIACEEDIHVTEEVYRRPVFTAPLYRYHRLPLPMEGAPMEEDFDAFVKILRETPSLGLARDPARRLPALLFSCQVGVGRTNLAMILGTLAMNRLRGPAREPPEVEGLAPSEPRPLLRVIQSLIDKLPNGQQIMEEGSSTKDYFRQRTMQSLERYFYLIVFNAFLHEQWMCGRAWLYRLLAAMDLSELSAPADLVTRGARVLVADEYLAPDVLSTLKEMKVANFRRVAKMPVYGMAQPTSEATAVVLAHLTDEKRKHRQVLWVNLQEELVLEGNGQVFTPREPSSLEQHIPLPSADPALIEKLELSLKEEVLRAQKWLEVTMEQDKQMKMFKSCRTVREAFAQHQSTHPGLLYRRGFPEFGDDEIVSVPDAKYTKGEFELVRRLPDGHRMKREVDMALDSVSETMTPMHYHLRENIISTYRQIKSAKGEKESEQLLLKSLQYLERYMYLILFNTYLHLEKKDSWQRSFSLWMEQVAARAGVYDILNQLCFSEFESPRDSPLARLRCRWRLQSVPSRPFRGEFI